MIKLIMDLENKVWNISGEPESDSAIFEFYIDMIPGKTPFKNFDYYFDISSEGADNIKITPEEPLTNSEETQFPYMVNKHFVENLVPGQTYTIDVTCKNRREFFSDKFTFTCDPPPKPYSSWIWNSDLGKWVAPADPPQLEWDELSQKWIIP